MDDPIERGDPLVAAIVESGEKLLKLAHELQEVLAEEKAKKAEPKLKRKEKDETPDEL